MSIQDDKILDSFTSPKAAGILLAGVVVAAVLIFVIVRFLHALPIVELLFIIAIVFAAVFFVRKKIIQNDAEAAEALQQAKEALMQADLQAKITNRSRLEFLGNMSHELRTPLNAVIGFSEIIKNEVMGPLGADAYKHYAQDIYDSGHHLLKIISEILEVAKLETGGRELTASNFKINKAVTACLTIMSNRIEQSGIKVQTHIPADLPEILVKDKTALTVCPLSNLKLCVVKDMKQHPLKKMLEMGLKATINSDDPAYFGGYMNDNFRAVTEALNLDKSHLVSLTRNAIEASFVSVEEKNAMLKKLNDFAAKNEPGALKAPKL